MAMTVKELKALIANIPDEADNYIVIVSDGDDLVDITYIDAYELSDPLLKYYPNLKKTNKYLHLDITK